MSRWWIFGCAAIAAACGSSSGKSIDGAPGTIDGAGGTPDAFTGPYSDFPISPVIDTGGTTPPPVNAPDLFGDPASGAATGGPCLDEPEIGTLYPNNWLRPRFDWIAGPGQNLFEVRLEAANEINPLVVYTTATRWTMPADMWAGLSAHIVDAPITVTVRGAAWDGTNFTGLARGSTGDIAIAPVGAPGAIVYWTTTGGSALRGFHVGDETVRDIVRPANANTACVGCHSSTPDGMFVGFSASPNAGNGDPTMFGLRTVDGLATEAPFLTDQAKQLMARQNQEQPVFSAAHWSAGDHVGLTMFPIANKFEITWTNLEATSTAQDQGWGILARTDDTNPAAYASFAHTSDNVLYVSSTNVSSGVTVAHGDLRTVPYANHTGGATTAIPGASEAAFNEYYPTFSPDDQLIAYNRVADGQNSYNNRQAEVYVIPGAGGTPVRIAANDPSTCSGKVSPGVTNSWPKWAPAVGTSDNRKFYWLTFSSTRSAAGNPQLYVTPVVVDGTGVHTYPALYLWNQPTNENNHTPAWDVFNIPVN